MATVIGSLMFSACGNRDKARASGTKNVKTVIPHKREAVSERTLPGVVNVAQEINIGFKTAGQISNIYVREGDYVREGTEMARLDDNDYRLQLRATEAQYNQMSAEQGRMEELFRRNNVSGNDYEKFLAGYEQLLVQLEANRNTVKNTVLKAPVSGYIQSVKVGRSEMVNAGTPVFTIIDASDVEVQVELPASLFLRQSDFTGYRCSSNLLPDKDVALRFAGINHKPNSSQLYRMRLVPEKGSGLAPGMNVEVVISIDDARNAGGYTLPAKTVVQENGKTYVWTVDGGQAARKKEVLIGGLDGSGKIIILSGILETDLVIEAGLRTLNENDNVSVIPETTETNKGGLL